MANKYDDADGVWRTIGGRRVFIRTGQSLSDAMIESGKFSRVKKNEELYKKLDEEPKLTEKQKEAGEKLNKKAQDGVRNDIKDFLSGRENYDGSQEEFINDLSNEWGVDKNDVEDILNEEMEKHPRLFKNDRSSEIKKFEEDYKKAREEYHRKNDNLTEEQKYENAMIQDRVLNEYGATDKAREEIKKQQDANKYASAEHIGFGDYNKNGIPVYNNKIDYTGDFRNADLSTLSDEELQEAYKVQLDKQQEAYAETLGDQRTRNGKMNKIFNTARKQQYEAGVNKIDQELANRGLSEATTSNWKEQIEANNIQLEKDLKAYQDTHDITRESEGYYELFRENERRNAKIKQEPANEPYEFVQAYAGYRDKSYKLAGTKMSGKDVVEYGQKSWTGKEYTNDEFMEHLEDSNWHSERKALLDANLTNQELAYIKDHTTLSQWSVGEELTGKENVEKMIKEAKEKFRGSNATMNDKIRDEAFRKYKKEHPNSKITLEQYLKKQ